MAAVRGKAGSGACARRRRDLGFEPLLELLEAICIEQRDRFHGFGTSASGRAAHRRLPGPDQHTLPVLRAKAQQHGLASKQNDGELRAGVLEREVDVAEGAGRRSRSRPRPRPRVLPLHKLANLTDQLTHRPDARACVAPQRRSRAGARMSLLWHPLESVIGKAVVRLIARLDNINARYGDETSGAPPRRFLFLRLGWITRLESIYYWRLQSSPLSRRPNDSISTVPPLPSSNAESWTTSNLQDGYQPRMTGCGG